MKVHVLIDFDNLPSTIRNRGLVSLARSVHHSIESRFITVDEIRIRLYGGWYDTQGLTRDGTRLTQDIGMAFPLIIANNQQINCRIHCDIASSLIDTPADLLLHTFRQRNGIRSRLTVAHVPNCANQSCCVIQHVAQWSRGRCHVAGCGVSARSVFTYNEQKLVDTLLCCDLIVLATRGPRDPVYLVSDDDDMIPAILLASRLGGAIHLLETRTRQSDYGTLLQQYSVQISPL